MSAPTTHAAERRSGFPAPTIERDGWTYPNPEFRASIDARRIVSPATLRLIGARHKPGEFSKGYAVWTINPPVIGDPANRHYLSIQVGDYGVDVALLAQDRPDRGPHTMHIGDSGWQAHRRMHPDQADSWVLRYCTETEEVLMSYALGWYEPGGCMGPPLSTEAAAQLARSAEGWKSSAAFEAAS